jgi:hypothetical protein
MAYTSGTAANYKDLLSRMVTFAAANGWVVLEQSETRVYLKGTGLAGLDEIYCGVETYEDPVNGRYNWNLVGSWGYRAGRDLNAQPVSSNSGLAAYVAGHFWNTAIPYWMVCTPRRIIMAAKVGTTYQTIHLGLINPPATEGQYPYPLFIGGSLCGASATALAKNYSDTMAAFWSTSNTTRGRLSVPGGAWGWLGNGTGTPLNPYVSTSFLSSVYEATMLTGLDGSYLLEPVSLVADSGPKIFGTIDGLVRVTGYNNTAENIITVAGVNYLVLPDGSRSGAGDFCALRLN